MGLMGLGVLKEGPLVSMPTTLDRFAILRFFASYV